MRKLPQFDYNWDFYNWRYAVAFTVAILIWLGFELYGAIWRQKPGDTFTELVRPIIHAHPVVWYTTLAAFVGFNIWLLLHFWFGQK